MIRLKLVKSAEAESRINPRENVVDATFAAGDGLPHGGVVLKELVYPWANTGRIVCADSYFASVAAAEALLLIGLKIIGVVKTATKNLPCIGLVAMSWAKEANGKG